MDAKPKQEKPDLTAEELAELRLPPVLSQSEREVYEAKIAELQKENAELKNIPTPEPEPAKKGFFDRFAPL